MTPEEWQADTRTDCVEILRDFPAVNPRQTVIAVDPGMYCVIPDAIRNRAADEIERLRSVLRAISNYDTAGLDPATLARAALERT